MQKRRKTAAGKPREKQPKRPKEPTPLDLLKLEIAAELGLAEKIAVCGWAELTAAESGRLGGILNRRLRELNFAIGPRGSLVPGSKG